VPTFARPTHSPARSARRPDGGKPSNPVALRPSPGRAFGSPRARRAAGSWAEKSNDSVDLPPTGVENRGRGSARGMPGLRHTHTSPHGAFGTEPD
jgi:hypothetical protein